MYCISSIGSTRSIFVKAAIPMIDDDGIWNYVEKAMGEGMEGEAFKGPLFSTGGKLCFWSPAGDFLSPPVPAAFGRGAFQIYIVLISFRKGMLRLFSLNWGYCSDIYENGNYSQYNFSE